MLARPLWLSALLCPPFLSRRCSGQCNINPHPSSSTNIARSSFRTVSIEFTRIVTNMDVDLRDPVYLLWHLSGPGSRAKAMEDLIDQSLVWRYRSLDRRFLCCHTLVEPMCGTCANNNLVWWIAIAASYANIVDLISNPSLHAQHTR